jgi:hypothetical protein
MQYRSDDIDFIRGLGRCGKEPDRFASRWEGDPVKDASRDQAA